MESQAVKTKRRIGKDHNHPGTILDGRYKLGEIVGKGGFSIVYDAVNIHTGQRVAIKECTSEETKDGFLREARLLGDFANEQAIVSVLDYFDDDDTAYIVMEFLEGETLRKHVKENGAISVEEAVGLFSPVMKTLTVMHNEGVVHRDISPDNLMMMSDGTLKLLDFGAAREYVNNRVSRLIYKNNYSPPELRDETCDVGSWTDVYSLCATLYFCITGHDPEDVVSRLLFDELKKPRDLGVDISVSAEKTIMQGLEPKMEERIQSVEKVRSSLEKEYPILSEEEKLAAAKASRRKRMIAASLLIAVVAAAAVFVNAHRLQIMFHMIDTQKVVLYGNNMDDKDFAENADKVRKRVDAFSGGRYTWKQDGKTIRFEVPESLFENADPYDYVRLAISRPIRIYLSVYDKDEDMLLPVEIISQTEDVEEVRDDNGKTRIFFTDEAQKRLKRYLNDEGLQLGFCYDIYYADNYSSSRAVSAGDGKSIILDDTEEDPETQLTYPDELEELHYTESPLSKGFSAFCKWDIKWESPENSLIAGEKQLSYDDLKSDPDKGNIVYVRYEKGYTKDDVHGHKAFMYEIQAIIKNRLDALEIPYAVGIDRYDNNAIIVGVIENSVPFEVLAALGEIIGISEGIGGAAGTSYDVICEDIGIDQSGIFMTLFDNDDRKTEILETVEQIKSRGENNLFSYWEDTPVAFTDIDAALDDIGKNDQIHFDKWDFSEEGKTVSDNFAQFINIGMEQYPNGSFSMKDWQMVDKNGYPITAGNPFPYLLETNARAKLYFEELENEDGDDPKIIRTIDGRNLTLEYYYDATEDDAYKKALEAVCEYYKEHSEQLTDGTFSEIELEIASENGDDGILQNDKGRYVYSKTYAHIRMEWSTDRGAYMISRIVTKTGERMLGRLYWESDSDIRNYILDYCKKDPVLSPMLTEETDVY